jgi:sigma-54 specific flagellar transcriptional regulator A
MMNNKNIYIIDDDKGRSDKLRTLFDFIDHKVDLFTFAEVEKISNLSPNVILLGAYSSPDKTLQQLDFIVKDFSQTPCVAD